MARRRRPDPFIVSLFVAAAIGILAPASGIAAAALGYVKAAAIGLLFFLQGVRLQRAALIAGMMHWRLQSLTLASTFVVFPLLGFALHALVPGVLNESLWLGMLYLCALPSTVQSSIAFTSIAKGNVPAAVCAATVSNLLGIAITPLLVTLLLNLHASASAPEQIEAIVKQLVLPLVAGQLLSRWLLPWATRHPALVATTDRASILLVVYAACSAAVLAGAWSDLPWQQLASMLALSTLLLALVLCFTRLASRTACFEREDEIAIVFCGSKKSLATGLPMANILFPATSVGLVILPVLVFHQLQLMVCAYIAQRYAESDAGDQSAVDAHHRTGDI
ncbi:MAG: bile acid:sodium symporter [Proteobacteria bacterium]|nr:bile acid:sodium symporter [Pseudomonadota bacterium]